jgi:chemotaxis methyl-accepting protein methylase
MHVSALGNGHLACVSQHAQFLGAGGFIALWQSPCSDGAAAFISAAIAIARLICATAHADVTGAKISDRAIRIATMARMVGKNEPYPPVRWL